jgi:DNA-binding SARP family transcriptional activator
MTARWRIDLLGELRASQGDRVITRFRTRKTAALLAYLAYFPEHAHAREVLIQLLWPECEPEGGRSRLSVALSSLRDQLESPDPRTNADTARAARSGTILVADRFSVRLNPAAISTDVARFESALQSGGASRSAPERIRALAEAVELYRGELLPGFYEDWILPEKQRLEERFFRALHQLVLHLEQAGEIDRAIRYAQQAVSADPLREEAHQELMRVYAAAGQPRLALRQYKDLARMLKQEMGAAPGAAARALARTIADELKAAGGPDETITLAAASPWQIASTAPASQLEPIGGAVPMDSRFYVARPGDIELAAAVERRDSIVLIKGTRQVGKSSLLARGLQHARQTGARVVRTDFQMFNASHLVSAESLLLTLAQQIVEQLDLAIAPDEVWDSGRGPNPNFRRFMEREVLGVVPTPLVWALDQVDRLFQHDFGAELFGLFRSWHNERAFDPAGPWGRLTLAIAYATEAHLFISDVDQSPFNVGTRLTLEDFTREQVEDLNRRYNSPLRSAPEMERFYRLVGGHPYLVRRGLHEMATQGADIAAFECSAPRPDWIFGDHLRRVLVLLSRDPELCEVARTVIQGQPCRTLESFYRLRTAGVVVGSSERDVRPRCQLYAIYLQRLLL